jgi:hypothetical protein
MRGLSHGWAAVGTDWMSIVAYVLWLLVLVFAFTVIRLSQRIDVPGVSEAAKAGEPEASPERPDRAGTAAGESEATKTKTGEAK